MEHASLTMLQGEPRLGRSNSQRVTTRAFNEGYRIGDLLSRFSAPETYRATAVCVEVPTRTPRVRRQSRPTRTPIRGPRPALPPLAALTPRVGQGRVLGVIGMTIVAFAIGVAIGRLSRLYALPRWLAPVVSASSSFPRVVEHDELPVLRRAAERSYGARHG